MLPQTEGNTPETPLDAGGGQSPSGQEPGRDYEAEIADLRKENAKWRTDFREAQKQLKDLQPLAEKAQQLEDANKSEVEKLAAKMADLERQANQYQAQAAQAEKVAKLTALGARAGVPADMLQFLDASKFDLDDEERALEALSALAPKGTANAGKPSNPARGGAKGEDDPATWWKNQTGQTPTIFGG